ncbi:hypothetical protein OIU34_05190 [Pararhizobium sp. BT-229]|nr:hypothetical protein [Pararhizobium sp. BT-229]MCV9961288.1 hypothetical protein [Pararhizobium sp. BT-229]
MTILEAVPPIVPPLFIHALCIRPGLAQRACCLALPEQHFS